MRWLPFIVLVLAGALLEAGNLLNLIAIGDWHIRPAVLVVPLVFFSMHCRLHEAIITAFILGLGMDLSGSLMGPHTISYCLVGGLLNQLSEHFPAYRVIHQAILIFAAFLVTETVAYWLSVLKTGEYQEYVYRILLLTALYSACLGPLLWQLLYRVNRLIAVTPQRPERRRSYLR